MAVPAKNHGIFSITKDAGSLSRAPGINGIIKSPYRFKRHGMTAANQIKPSNNGYFLQKGQPLFPFAGIEGKTAVFNHFFHLVVIVALYGKHMMADHEFKDFPEMIMTLRIAEVAEVNYLINLLVLKCCNGVFQNICTSMGIGYQAQPGKGFQRMNHIFLSIPMLEDFQVMAALSRPAGERRLTFDSEYMKLYRI